MPRDRQLLKKKKTQPRCKASQARAPVLTLCGPHTGQAGWAFTESVSRPQGGRSVGPLLHLGRTLATRAFCWAQQPGGPHELPYALLMTLARLPPDTIPASCHGEARIPKPSLGRSWAVGGSCRKQDPPSLSGVPHKPLPCGPGSCSASLPQPPLV